MYLTHITTEGERWDQLAAHYYGDPFLYSLIIAANPHLPIHSALKSGWMVSIPLIAQQKHTEDLPPWKR